MGLGVLLFCLSLRDQGKGVKGLVASFGTSECVHSPGTYRKSLSCMLNESIALTI